MRNPRNRRVERRLLLNLLIIQTKVSIRTKIKISLCYLNAARARKSYNARVRDRFKAPVEPFGYSARCLPIYAPVSTGNCINGHIRRSSLIHSLDFIFFFPLLSRLNLQGLFYVNKSNPGGGGARYAPSAPLSPSHSVRIANIFH